jgi:hypothetical protein
MLPHRSRCRGCMGSEWRSPCTRISPPCPASMERCSLASVASLPSPPPPCIPHLSPSPSPSCCSSPGDSESGVRSPFGAEMEDGPSEVYRRNEQQEGAAIPPMGRVSTGDHAQERMGPTLHAPSSCILSEANSQHPSLPHISPRIHAFLISSPPPHSPLFALTPFIPPTRLAIAGACYNSIASLVGIASLDSV